MGVSKMAKSKLSKRIMVSLLCTSLAATMIIGSSVIAYADTTGSTTSTSSSEAVSELVNNSTVSHSVISQGDKVKINAIAGGGSGSYKYAMFVKHESASKWSTLLKTGTTSVSNWKPTLAGTYSICVKVFDANDSSGAPAKKYFTLTVKEPTFTLQDETYNGVTFKGANYSYHHYTDSNGVSRIDGVTFEGFADPSNVGTDVYIPSMIMSPDGTRYAVKEIADSGLNVTVNGVVPITKVRTLRIPTTVELINSSAFANLGSATSSGTTIKYSTSATVAADNSVPAVTDPNLSTIASKAFESAKIKSLHLYDNVNVIRYTAFDKAYIGTLYFEDGFSADHDNDVSNGVNYTSVSYNLFKPVYQTVNSVKTKMSDGGIVSKVYIAPTAIVSDIMFRDMNTKVSSGGTVTKGVVYANTASYFYSVHSFTNKAFSNVTIFKVTGLSSTELEANNVTMSFVNSDKTDSVMDFIDDDIDATTIKKSGGYIKVYNENYNTTKYIPISSCSVNVTTVANEVGSTGEFTATSSTYGLKSDITYSFTVQKCEANEDNITLEVVTKRGSDGSVTSTTDIGSYINNYELVKDSHGNVVGVSGKDAFNELIESDALVVKYNGKILSADDYTIKFVDNKYGVTMNSGKFVTSYTPYVEITVNDNDYCNASKAAIKKTMLYRNKIEDSTITAQYYNATSNAYETFTLYDGTSIADKDKGKTVNIKLPAAGNAFGTLRGFRLYTAVGQESKAANGGIVTTFNPKRLALYTRYTCKNSYGSDGIAENGAGTQILTINGKESGGLISKSDTNLVIKITYDATYKGSPVITYG